MERLPAYISVVFIITTMLTVFFFYKAANKRKLVMILLLAWLITQAIVSLSGFYTITQTYPPRFLLLVLPPVVLIGALFSTAKGRTFIDSLEPGILTLLHSVRVPVEVVLYWLFINRAVPELMTFEGRNFDIFSGLTAPLIFYFGYVRKQAGRRILLLWNFICLGLLINIVANAVLSAPFPFQRFAFDQPNVAVLYFPFVWLPCCIVPLVLLAHLATIRQLLYRHNSGLT